MLYLFELVRLKVFKDFGITSDRGKANHDQHVQTCRACQEQHCVQRQLEPSWPYGCGSLVASGAIAFSLLIDFVYSADLRHLTEEVIYIYLLTMETCATIQYSL